MSANGGRVGSVARRRSGTNVLSRRSMASLRKRGLARSIRIHSARRVGGASSPRFPQVLLGRGLPPRARERAGFGKFFRRLDRPKDKGLPERGKEADADRKLRHKFSSRALGGTLVLAFCRRRPAACWKRGFRRRRSCVFSAAIAARPRGAGLDVSTV